MIINLQICFYFLSQCPTRKRPTRTRRNIQGSHEFKVSSELTLKELKVMVSFWFSIFFLLFWKSIFSSSSSFEYFCNILIHFIFFNVSFFSIWIWKFLHLKTTKFIKKQKKFPTFCTIIIVEILFFCNLFINKSKLN